MFYTNYLSQRVLLYQWLEDSLKLGEKVCEDSYHLQVHLQGQNKPGKSLVPKSANENTSSGGEPSPYKKIKSSPQDVKNFKAESRADVETNGSQEGPNSPRSSDTSPFSQSPSSTSPKSPSAPDMDVRLNNYYLILLCGDSMVFQFLFSVCKHIHLQAS